jgi:hypothetical protein
MTRPRPAPLRYVALRNFVPEMTPLRRAMLVRRARMHLQTARWLAELRADWLWESACRAAIASLESLDHARNAAQTVSWHSTSQKSQAYLPCLAAGKRRQVTRHGP